MTELPEQLVSVDLRIRAVTPDAAIREVCDRLYTPEPISDVERRIDDRKQLTVVHVEARR